MKIHLRFDSNNDAHVHMSLFVNKKLTGTLTMSPAEAIWFDHILELVVRAGETGRFQRLLNLLFLILAGRLDEGVADLGTPRISGQKMLHKHLFNPLGEGESHRH